MQNLLTPWKFKQMNFSKNFIIRNDIILDVDSKFELNQERIYRKLFNMFNELSIKLERPQHSQLRSIYGISSSADYSTSCRRVLNGIVIDMMNVMIHLTQHIHPVDVSRYIQCDVKELPDFVLDLVQFINSHKNAIEFQGTDASIIRFNSVSVFYKFEDNVTESKYSLRELPMSLIKLNMACKMLGMPMRSINVNDLFVRHDAILNAYTKDKVDEKGRILSTKVFVGNGCNEYDAQVALLLKTHYQFSDDECIDEYSAIVSSEEVESILNIESTEGSSIAKYTYNPDVLKSAAEAAICFGIKQSQKVEGFGDVERLSDGTKNFTTKIVDSSE